VTWHHLFILLYTYVVLPVRWLCVLQELFGAVGAVKCVKLVKKGQADVVYVRKEDAFTATNTYHERELDGTPLGI